MNDYMQEIGTTLNLTNEFKEIVKKNAPHFTEEDADKMASIFEDYLVLEVS